MNRPARPAFGFPPLEGAVRGLMIAMFGIWLLFGVGINLFESVAVQRLWLRLTLSPRTLLFEGSLWQVLTAPWLHDQSDWRHIGFNMLGLYFLGGAVQRELGTRRFLRFWLLSGALAGFFALFLVPIFPGRFGVPHMGASGALMAVTAAYSMLRPNGVVRLMFIIPIRGSQLIWIALGLDLLAFIALPAGGVAYHVHLMGAFAGWLLISESWRPRVLRARLAGLRRKKPPSRSGLRVVPGGRDQTYH